MTASVAGATLDFSPHIGLRLDDGVREAEDPVCAICMIPNRTAPTKYCGPVHILMHIQLQHNKLPAEFLSSIHCRSLKHR